MMRTPTLVWLVRSAWGFAGLLGFLWIGFEDRGPTTALLMAALLAFAGGTSVLARVAGSRVLTVRGWLLRCALVGLGAGGTIAPLGALLMAIKVSLHAHAVPDFTLADLSAVIGRTHVWAAAGLLVGVAFGVFAVASASESGST